MRYFLQITYNGSNYHGWQIQDNALTIQFVLNTKLSIQLGTQINCIGCGRTDTGVHAKKFFLHFDFEGELPSGFVQKLNSFLPNDIVVKKIFTATDDDANARWSATERTYRYITSIGRNPLMNGYAAVLYKEPEIYLMNEASKILLRYNDYEALSKRSPEEEHHLSNITYANWKKKGDLLVFTITANRFLRGMVRIVVGTLFEVGKGKISPEDFENIIAIKDRKGAFGAAPAEGLYLWDVKYPEGIMKELK